LSLRVSKDEFKEVLILKLAYGKIGDSGKYAQLNPKYINLRIVVIHHTNKLLS
jgi:hypothetical protein